MNSEMIFLYHNTLALAFCKDIRKYKNCILLFQKILNYTSKPDKSVQKLQNATHSGFLWKIQTSERKLSFNTMSTKLYQQNIFFFKLWNTVNFKLSYLWIFSFILQYALSFNDLHYN